MKNLIIYFGEYKLIVCEAKWVNNSFFISSLNIHEIPFNIYEIDFQKQFDEIIAAISETLGERETNNGFNTVVIPDSQTYSRTLEMPILTEAELISSIKYQADQFIPLPITDVYLDLDVLYKDKKNNKLLILFTASSKSHIIKIQNIFSYVGLTINRVVPEQIVFYDTLSSLLLSRNDSIYLNMGLTASTFSFFLQEPTLIFDIHAIKYGTDLIAKDIQRNLSIPYQQAIRITQNSFDAIPERKEEIYKIAELPVKELVNHIFQYITSIESRYGFQIKNIYIHGESSSNLQIIDMLKNNLPSLTINNLEFPTKKDKNSESLLLKFASHCSSLYTILGACIP